MDLDRHNLENLSRLLGPDYVLGELAVRKGLLNEDQLRAARRKQTDTLADVLRLEKLLSDDQLNDLRDEAGRLERQQAAGDAPSLLPDDPARKIGRYTLVEEIGSGGAGVVWKAWDTQLARWVALKKPRFNQGVARDRFLREARAAARLSHPNLIEIHEISTHEDTDYLVMELVEGRSLDECPADPRTQAARLADVCDAVEAMHRAGVLHRDIKPQNILIDPGGRAHLGDFGVAKLVGDEPLTLEGTLLGTPQYMAPEQLERKSSSIGPATDVYGLGAALFHALTGQPPYAGEEALPSLIAKVQTEESPAPRSVRPDLPADLDRITRRAMARDPVDRYGTAADLAADLRRFVSGEPVLAHPPSAARRASRWLRRNRFLTAAALLVAGVVVAAMGYAFRVDSRVTDLLAQREAYESARQRGDELWLKAVGFTRGAEIDRDGLDRAASDALAEFERAARLLPKEPYPHLMMGRCRSLRGETEEAVADWNLALTLNPDYAPALLERGKHYLSRYADLRLPRRTRVGGARIRFGPPDPADRSLKSARFMGLEDLNRARRAPDLDPAALASLEGISLLGDARFEEAAEKLEAYAREYPWDSEALLFLGAARYQDRKFTEAAAAWQRATRLRPHALVHRLLGDAQYCLGRFDDAGESYAQALGLDPRDPVARCNRGLALQAAGRTDEAIEDYTRVIAHHPRFARALNARGTARYARGDYPAAAEDFERALDVNEFFPEAHNNLGNARVMLAEVDLALTEYDIALSLDPEYLDAYLNRGEAHLLQGDAARAVKDFETAASLDPRNPEIPYALARAWQKRGNRGEALRAVSQAIKLSSPDSPIRKRAQRLLRELSGK